MPTLVYASFGCLIYHVRVSRVSCQAGDRSAMEQNSLLVTDCIYILLFIICFFFYFFLCLLYIYIYIYIYKTIIVIQKS